MLTYRLTRYSFDLKEELIMEHEDEEIVVNNALSISKESDDSIGFYTYRLEVIKDGVQTFRGFRFFNNGREFTQDIRNAVREIV